MKVKSKVRAGRPPACGALPPPPPPGEDVPVYI